MILYNQKPLLGKFPLWTPNPMGIPAPVATWAENEGTGGKVCDQSGNGTNGILTGNAAWCNTAKGRGLTFPTVNSTDRLNLGSIDANHPLSHLPEITLITCVHRLVSFNNGYPRIFDKSNGGNLQNGWGFYWREIGSCYEFMVGGSSTGALGKARTSNLGVSDCYENIGVVAKQNSYIKIYVNGADKTTASNYDPTYPFQTTTTNAAIGNWNHSTDRQWNGGILYVYIFDKILTKAQIDFIHLRPYYAWEYPELWEYYVAAAGWTGKVNGVTNPAKINGVAVANIAKVMGIS